MILEKKAKELQVREPSKKDGFIEFTCANTILGMSLGRFHRIGQSKGPIKFHFNSKDDFVTYINIDGEYFRSINASSITIRLASYLENGCVRVL